MKALTAEDNESFDTIYIYMMSKAMVDRAWLPMVNGYSLSFITTNPDNFSTGRTGAIYLDNQ